MSSIYAVMIGNWVQHEARSRWKQIGELSALRGVYSDTTQLNSTSSCRHVHSVNNSHRSVLNVVTQLTQFVGHDVIYDVFMTCFDEFAGRWNFGVKNLK